jgi:hypothetical protein
MTEYELTERLFALDEKFDTIREILFQCSDELRAVLELMQKEKEELK